MDAENLFIPAGSGGDAVSRRTGGDGSITILSGRFRDGVYSRANPASPAGTAPPEPARGGGGRLRQSYFPASGFAMPRRVSTAIAIRLGAA